MPPLRKHTVSRKLNTARNELQGASWTPTRTRLLNKPHDRRQWVGGVVRPARARSQLPTHANKLSKPLQRSTGRKLEAVASAGKSAV